MDSQICDNCGNEFEAGTTGFRFFCGDNCYRKHLRKNNPEYRQARIEYSRRHKKENPDKLHDQQRICGYCGIEFQPIHGSQKYCSKECSKNERNKRMKGYHRGYRKKHKKYKENNPKTCLICNSEFNPKHPNQKYCSNKCSYNARLNQRKKVRDRDSTTRIYKKKSSAQGFIARRCPVCKLLFVTNNPRKKYCSAKCKTRQKYTKHLGQEAKHRPFIERKCPECKLLFTTNNPRKKYCSTKCSQRFHGRKWYRTNPKKKTEVCKHIYDTRDDPDSISDLIEDLTGMHCNRKMQDKKEDHRTESPDRGPWEISSTKKVYGGCVICGFAKDKSGKYCKDCWKSMKRKYDPRAVKVLGKLDITVEQKRKCLSCVILPTCIEVGNVRDGCDTIFKSLRKEAKKKIRSLGKMVTCEGDIDIDKIVTGMMNGAPTSNPLKNDEMRLIYRTIGWALTDNEGSPEYQGALVTWIILDTGMRLQDATTLNVDSLILSSDNIPSIIWVIKKSTRQNKVSISIPLYQAIHRWLKIRPDVDHSSLFVNQMGDRPKYSWVYHWFRRISNPMNPNNESLPDKEESDGLSRR